MSVGKMVCFHNSLEIDKSYKFSFSNEIDLMKLIVQYVKDDVLQFFRVHLAYPTQVLTSKN